MILSSEPQPIRTMDEHRRLVVNRTNIGDEVVVSWRSDMDAGGRDAVAMTTQQARNFAAALVFAADVADGLA